MRDRAVDDFLDAGIFEQWHHLCSCLELIDHSIHIWRQQLLTKSFWNTVFRPDWRIRIIRPEDQALAFLAQVKQAAIFA